MYQQPLYLYLLSSRPPPNLLLKGITNAQMSPSEGFICKLYKKASEGLKQFKSELRKNMICRTLLYWDDTVIMIQTKRVCMRFYGDEFDLKVKQFLKKGERENKASADTYSAPFEKTVIKRIYEYMDNLLWKENRYAGSLSRCTFQRQFRIMKQRSVFHNRKSQTCTASFP